MLKKMENPNNHRVSNFWFGFAIGGVTISAAFFFFGTKKGRQTLKTLLEASENLEENFLTILEELEENLEEKEEEIKEILTKKPKNYNLVYLLDKIKKFTPYTKKHVKKFFVREGKIIEKST